MDVRCGGARNLWTNCGRESRPIPERCGRPGAGLLPNPRCASGRWGRRVRAPWRPPRAGRPAAPGRGACSGARARPSGWGDRRRGRDRRPGHAGQRLRQPVEHRELQLRPGLEHHGALQHVAELAHVAWKGVARQSAPGRAARALRPCGRARRRARPATPRPGGECPRGRSLNGGTWRAKTLSRNQRSSRKRPAAISACRSRLVAATTRARLVSSELLPTRR